MSIQNNQDINAQMAAALAAQSGESVQDVSARVDASESDKASKLSAMLAQAAAAKAESGVKTPKAAKPAKAPKAAKEPGNESEKSEGTKRQRRNTDVTTRMIHVFTSASLNSKFISSNIMFDGKAPEKQVALLVNSKKKPADFMAATDMVCETVAIDIPVGDELEATKAQYHDQYVEAGFTMIGNRPKTPIKANEPAEAVTDEVITEHVETEATV